MHLFESVTRPLKTLCDIRNFILTGVLGSAMISGGAGLAAGSKANVTFDISAQPLQSALDIYGAAAGLEVLYDSRLAIGRRTRGLKGLFAPMTGLNTLLQGTGLTAVYVGTNAFAVIPVPAPRNNAAEPRSYRQYFGLVQSSIASTFCDQAEIRPGAYRIALRFWISPEGQIYHPELLSSSGDSLRDQAVSGTLAQVIVDLPPPRGMPQPITMVIAPRSPDKTGDCTSYAQGPR